VDHEKKIMLEEIRLQPDFLRSNGKPILDSLAAALKKHDISRIRHVFILGCGDSYFSALANRLSFMEMTGLYVEAIEALEFSRYIVNHMPSGSAVIGVSNSGTVSRTIEGVTRARLKGALTFAITTKLSAPLAQAVDIPLIVNSPPNIKERPGEPPTVTPGSVTYIASLLGVYCVGLSFGLRLGSLTDADARQRLQELSGVADAIAATIDSVEPVARDYAGKLAPEKRIIILGGGPNYGTAFFGMAKFFEALRQPASAVEMEEWAHEEYFVSDKDAVEFVICPPGESRDRAFEQMHAAREMQAQIVAVGSAADRELGGAADVVFPVQGSVREPLTPFVYCVPFELFACHLASARGRAFLGFDDPHRRQVNFRQIFNSPIKQGEEKR
jgi:glutamine---fructose-6-phosphate transaminase (isomerizing)